MNNRTYNGASPSISLAIEEAWTIMRRILFEPFDIGKWFVIGFSAWLATMGEGGCSSGGSGPGGGGHGGPDAEGAISFFHEYMAVILAVVAAVVIVLVVIGLVLMWVQSRGKFMLLDNVARDRAEIVAPWKAYRDEGNSLFLWRVGFGILSTVVVLLVVGLGVWLALPSITGRSFGPDAVIALVCSIPLLLLWILVVVVIDVLLEDFVVPVMYAGEIRTIAGWRVFLALFKARLGGFLLYLLVRLGLVMAAQVLILTLILLTCCCAGLIMIIPYVGTVLLLPVIIYFRALSLAYLRQFGPEFDVFPHPPELPVAPDAGEVGPPVAGDPGLAGDGI